MKEYGGISLREHSAGKWRGGHGHEVAQRPSTTRCTTGGRGKSVGKHRDGGGLWTEFCTQAEDDAWLWAPKLNDSVLCLDRDWRKFVFKLFDFFVTSRKLVSRPHRPDGCRLDVIVHPFSFYYGHVSGRKGSSDGTTAGLFGRTVQNTCCPTNFSGSWPWTEKCICDAFVMETQLDVEARVRLSLQIGNARGAELSSWEVLKRCLERADRHDLGRNVFSLFNSCSRQAVLQHKDLQRIMSMIQRTIDARVGNNEVLKKIMYDIVQQCCVLPECLKLSGISSVGYKPVGGRGGFADIYVGSYQGLEVALKKLRRSSEELRELFKEAIVWRQLNHEHILPFLGVSEGLSDMPDSIVLVSPWMELGDLASFSKEARQIEYEGIDFILQVAYGLEYLHSQEPHVIHGDLRGNNILVSKREDGSYRLQLTDFGITKIEQICTRATTHVSKGAPRWMAPELFDPPEGSSGFVTRKSDVYAYSMTCFEVFAGHHPFPQYKRDAGIIHAVLTEGLRPDRPPCRSLADKRGMNDAVWIMMEMCWNKDRTQRPSMRTIVEKLQAHACIASDNSSGSLTISTSSLSSVSFELSNELLESDDAGSWSTDRPDVKLSISSEVSYLELRHIGDPLEAASPRTHSLPESAGQRYFPFGHSGNPSESSEVPLLDGPRLNVFANTFVPNVPVTNSELPRRQKGKVKTTDMSGHELDLNSLRSLSNEQQSPPPRSPQEPSTSLESQPPSAEARLNVEAKAFVPSIPVQVAPQPQIRQNKIRITDESGRELVLDSLHSKHKAVSTRRSTRAKHNSGRRNLVHTKAGVTRRPPSTDVLSSNFRTGTGEEQTKPDSDQRKSRSTD